MDMNELSGNFASIAASFVKANLLKEAESVGSQAWLEDASSALNGILREEEILRAVEADRSDVLKSLATGLKKMDPPDAREIDERSKDVGITMAAAWMQCLVLALNNRPSLPLTRSLLPKKADLPPELLSALTGSLNTLPVSADDATQIMELLAVRVFSQARRRLELPSGLIIEVKSDSPDPYSLRRASPTTGPSTRRADR